MSYGVELINDHNYVVANSSDVNYVFRSSGTISDSDFFNHLGSSDASFCSMDVSEFNCPLIFFKSVDSNQRLSTVPGSGLTAGMLTPPGYALDKTIDVYKWWNLSIGTVQYYIFDKWIPPERSTYGMQIFDSGGGIIFDSGWRFLKLKKVIWLDPQYPNHSNQEGGSNWTNIGSVGDGDLAIAMPTPRFWDYYGLGTGSGQRLSECVHLDQDNNVLISLVVFGNYLDSPPATGWASINARSQVMIADVSGLPTSYNPVVVDHL